MTHWNILLESATDGQTTATVIGLPAFQVMATTWQLALDKIQQLLTQRLSKAEVVSLPIPDNPETNSWIKFGGISKGDSDFADIVEPVRNQSLLEVVATLTGIEEAFPAVDSNLLPLDDINL